VQDIVHYQLQHQQASIGILMIMAAFKELIWQQAF
jgi:hypothetical protein